MKIEIRTTMKDGEIWFIADAINDAFMIVESSEDLYISDALKDLERKLRIRLGSNKYPHAHKGVTK